MYARSPVISATTGSEQRLRYGLGEHRPYRWHGINGWNPAAVLDGWHSWERMDRECGHCGALAHQPCLNRAGVPMHSAHTGR